VLNARSERLLSYPREALFDLAADIESYPRFLTGWISAHVYERGAGFCRAEQTVGFGPVRLQFRSLAALQRPERLEITSDDPQFRHFHILWVFDPEEAGSLRVALGVELELRSRLLQMWLDRLGTASATDALRAFEQHARGVLGPAVRSL
jgi:coenzyme Q-binding protein COQ10